MWKCPLFNEIKSEVDWGGSFLGCIIKIRSKTSEKFIGFFVCIFIKKQNFILIISDSNPGTFWCHVEMLLRLIVCHRRSIFSTLLFRGLKSKANVLLGSFVEEKMECNIFLFYNEHRRTKRREKKIFRWVLLWHK